MKRQFRENTLRNKRSLYESIMKDVAKVVKRSLNEYGEYPTIPASRLPKWTATSTADYDLAIAPDGFIYPVVRIPSEERMFDYIENPVAANVENMLNSEPLCPMNRTQSVTVVDDINSDSEPVEVEVPKHKPITPGCHAGMSKVGEVWEGVAGSYTQAAEDDEWDGDENDALQTITVVEEVEDWKDANTYISKYEDTMSSRQLLGALKEGIVRFMYVKQDGEKRFAVGTKNKDIINKYFTFSNNDDKRKMRPNPLRISYFDMEEMGWRMFFLDKVQIIFDDVK